MHRVKARCGAGKIERYRRCFSAGAGDGIPGSVARFIAEYGKRAGISRLTRRCLEIWNQAVMETSQIQMLAETVEGHAQQIETGVAYWLARKGSFPRHL